MAGHVRIFILSLSLISCPAWGGADPTRPPDVWLNAVPGDAMAETKDSRLQSVLRPKNGRPLAIIGGQTVALGQRYGDAILIRVNESDVVLRGEDGITRLYLTPQVDKRMLKAGSGKPEKKKEAP